MHGTLGGGWCLTHHARPNNCDDIEVIGPTPPFDPGPFPGPLSRVRDGGGILGRTMTGTTVSPVQVEDTVVLNENGVVYEGRKVNSTVALPTGFDGLGLQATERVALLPGFASPKGTSFTAKTTDNCDDRVSWPYEYAIHDHLGNVRVRFTDEGVIEGEHHYYPFGLEMEGEWNAGLDDARYRYNGKEYNDQIGLYDYGARNYDPAIGRWLQIDPLANTYAPFSPYNYTLNNPIKYIDPDGKKVVLANRRKTALQNLARIITFSNGANKLRRLISSNNTYSIQTTNFTYSSGYDWKGTDGPSRSIYAVGRSWSLGIDGGVMRGQYALYHELNHAYDHEVGSNMNNRRELERKSVTQTNVMRSIFGETSMRKSYSGLGLRFSGDPDDYNGADRHVTNFEELEYSESASGNALFFKYDYEERGKDIRSTQYGAVYTNSEGAVDFKRFNNKEAYQVFLQIVRNYESKDD